MPSKSYHRAPEYLKIEGNVYCFFNRFSKVGLSIGIAPL